MKVPTVSTLWDYINRAMPWNAPKSLTTDEVYAVTAFLLNLGGMVPDDFTLSDKNMAEVQGRMPNRNGMTTKHAMWPGKQHGADTTRPEAKVGAPALVAAPAAPKVEAPSGAKAALALLQKNGCTACHGVNNKIVGPAFTDVAKKHAGKADYLAGKIKSGGSGIWGAVPMPPQTLSDAEAKTIAAWLASGAGK
jgi:cytochrome c551/c552